MSTMQQESKSMIDTLYQVPDESDEKTFQYDESLPPLPLPPLDNTLNKYLDTVRPHVTEEEFAVTEQLVKEFKDGKGKELHQLLSAKASKERNWVNILASVNCD